MNAAVGAYYYLRIVVKMYLGDPPSIPLEPRPAWPIRQAVAACAGLSLILGCFPAPIARATHDAAESALQRPEVSPEPTVVEPPPSLNPQATPRRKAR